MPCLNYQCTLDDALYGESPVVRHQYKVQGHYTVKKQRKVNGYILDSFKSGIKHVLKITRLARR